MELLTKEFIQELLAADQEPCLSLYMPTHQRHPENLQDIILFKNLVKHLGESLILKYSSQETEDYLKPFDILIEDHDFWNHTSDGLAIFSADGLFKVVGVHKSFDELAIVADSFHTKPLMQYMQSLDHFHVLGLSLNEIKLFEGDRHSITEIDLTAKTPKNIKDVVGNDLTEPSLNGDTSIGILVESIAMHIGNSGKKDETGKDEERFFREVGEVIYEHFSKPTGWPLILAALPEHHNLFRKVNKNPLLLSYGITINPTSVSPDQLAKMAWKIMEPEYISKLDKLVDQYENAKAKGKGSDEYKEVAVAAVEGRVDILLVEADRLIPIRITNLTTGNTQKKDLINPKVDDLLDDMGELVLKMGGQVMVLPVVKMPTETGLAAIFRY
jgi:hypothetical protein